MNAPGAIRALWLAGALALPLAWVRDSLTRFERLFPADTASRALSDGGFKPDAVPGKISRASLPPGLAIVGSWSEAGRWQGKTEAAWSPLPARVGSIRVFVAGFPQHRGCALRAEFRRADGFVFRIDCDLPNPAEAWAAWDCEAPSGSVALRLVAEDNAGEPQGWLGFSEPLAKQRLGAAGLAVEFAQAWSAFALVVTLVWVPGLALARFSTRHDVRLVILLGAGPFALVAIALVTWLGGGVARPSVISAGLTALWWALLGCLAWRKDFAPDFSPPAWRALAVSLLCALAAVMRAATSDGPAGELYGGLIARTLAVGDRSDARISYYTPQIIQRHLAPASAEAERYFTPWTYFSRGPLAGLVATPIVLATGGRPAPVIYSPAEATAFYRWHRFDTAGYAAYRITLIVLAAMVSFALFLALSPIVGETWGLVASGVLALCPFGLHEVMFTWPKWEATAWVIASFALAHHRAALLAGLALAVGFLFHPLAALWAPWLALWAAGRAWPDRRAALKSTACFTAGVAALVVPWMALGKIPAQLTGSIHAGQGGFVGYFLLADYEPATWASWWQARGMNFANTFLPFWLHFFHEGHPSIGSPFAPSGGLVKFAFGWWNTLPLGLGLAVWLGAMSAIVRHLKQHLAAALLLIAGPALLLTAYWGAAPTGLMRECAHPLLVAIIGVACLGLARSGGVLSRAALHPALPWLQLPETLLMLWLTTVANPHQPAVDGRALNPLCATISVLALGAAALILSRARGADSPT